jgi:hypothetical protein
MRSLNAYSASGANPAKSPACEWTFSREKLNQLTDRIDRHEPPLALAA